MDDTIEDSHSLLVYIGIGLVVVLILLLIYLLIKDQNETKEPLSNQRIGRNRYYTKSKNMKEARTAQVKGDTRKAEQAYIREIQRPMSPTEYLQSLYELALMYRHAHTPIQDGPRRCKIILEEMANCRNTYYSTLASLELLTLRIDHPEVFNDADDRRMGITDQLRELERFMVGLINVPTVVRADNTIRTDTQNVHDHAVQNGIKKAIAELKKHYKGPMNNQTAQVTLRKMIDLCSTIQIKTKEDGPNVLTNERRAHAIEALQRICDADLNDKLNSWNTSEKEILILVWARIETYDPETKQQARENLVNNLASMIEHGHVVCLTGRVSRLIDSINVIDPIVNIKPVWAHREEMIRTANNVRNEYFERLSPDDKILVETAEPLSPDDKIRVDQWSETVKVAIKERIKTDYIDSGVMNASLVNAEVSQWINDIT